MKHVFCLLALFAGPVLAETQPPAFSQTGLSGWAFERFSGDTRYQIVNAGDQPVLAAHTVQAASGLSWEVDIQLDN